MRYKLLIPLALVAALTVAAFLAHADVPQNMNVHGRLTDATGAPLGQQAFIFTFKIYDMEVNGTEIWPAGPGETQAISTSNNGVWNATLGDSIALPASVFDDSARWLEITVDDGDHPAEVLSRLKLNSTPYSGRSATSKNADNGVPVGTVIDWWRPDASFPVPDGYQICDGSTITDPESPLNGFALPDLRDQFVRGAPTLADIGTAGGGDTHDHGYTTSLEGHNHEVSPPKKPTSSDGIHAHSVDPPATVSAQSGGHGHTLNPGLTYTATSWTNHAHTVDPPAGNTSNDGLHTHTMYPNEHNHQWITYNMNDNTWRSWQSDGSTLHTMADWENGMADLGAGEYPLKDANASYSYWYTKKYSHNHAFGSGQETYHAHATDPGPFSSESTLAGHLHTFDLGGTSTTSASHHTHGFNIASFASVGAGDHTHNVDLGSFGSATNIHNHNGTTVSQSNIPSHVALLKIMRIK